MEEYIISREQMLVYLEAQHRLAALENGGVDNWEWYGDSLQDYLKNYLSEGDEVLAQKYKGEDAEDFDFYDLAINELRFL